LDTPEELTRIDDIRGMVNAALEALPEAHRTAIMLREIDGLTYREIAATMAIPLGTVRSRPGGRPNSPTSGRPKLLRLNCS